MSDLINELINAKNEMIKTTEEVKKEPQELNELKGEIKNKLKDITAYETDINSIKERQSNLKNRLEKLEEKFQNFQPNDIQKDLRTLKENMTKEFIDMNNQNRSRMEDSLQSMRRSINNLDDAQSRQSRLISQNKDSINNLESRCSEFATKCQVRNAFRKGWGEVPHSWYRSAGIDFVESGGNFAGKNWGNTPKDQCWSAARDSI